MRRATRAAAAGKIRVVTQLGGTYLVGEVTEGSVTVNDIARLGNVPCPVLGAQPCERR